jgi:hypothetical protein
VSATGRDRKSVGPRRVRSRQANNGQRTTAGDERSRALLETAGHWAPQPPDLVRRKRARWSSSLPTKGLPQVLQVLANDAVATGASLSLWAGLGVVAGKCDPSSSRWSCAEASGVHGMPPEARRLLAKSTRPALDREGGRVVGALVVVTSAPEVGPDHRRVPCSRCLSSPEDASRPETKFNRVRLS